MNKILVVDDTTANVKILGELLKDQYTILVANNGQKAIQIARDMQPDLILMDVVMPEMDGFQACKILKSQAETAAIPVIFITALDEKDDIVKGFQAGGQDYITKPFNPQELFLRIETQLEIIKSRRRLKIYAEKLEEKNKDLKIAMEKLDTLAKVDSLTTLANRRYIMERIEEEAARSRRVGRSFSISILDIDNFKNINDRHGHDCGDRVLMNTASLLKNNLRLTDTAARWGGEEFLLLFPETTIYEAQTVCEEIRELIANSVVDYSDHRVTVTATFGVSEYTGYSNINDMIIAADRAMYEGKHSSKNCVVLA